ncbi:hypothetical protein YC2023_040031 [Brassica napus]
MTAARVLVGSRIIVQSHFSHRKKAPGRESGYSQEERSECFFKITQTDLAEAIGASLLQSIGGAYDREIKAGACLRITKRRDWSSAHLQWNEHA